MESPTILWHTFFFMLSGLLACAFAVAVVLTSNVVRMAFFLILSLAATSGLFFLAGADFVGAMQLMIYVGGTLVLLIFGVMLTAQSPFVSIKTRGGEWILAAIVGGSLLAVLWQVAFSVDNWRKGAPPDFYADAETDSSEAANDDPDVPPSRLGGPLPAADPRAQAARTATELGLSLLGARPDRLAQDEHSTSGLSGYLLPFEIISVHLLVVLIGAGYLARAKRRIKQS